MTFAQRLHKLVPDLSATLMRFPAPALASLIGAFIVNAAIVNDTLWTNQTSTRLIFAAAAAFAGSGAAHLFAEGRRWDRAPSLALAFGVGIVLALVVWFEGLLALHPLYFGVGMGLALMTAGFLRSDATQGAFWLFNFRLLLAALLAFVVSVVFCGGLSAIIASLEFLFEIKIPNDLYTHVWSTGASLIAPLYGLSLVPTRLDEEVALDRHTDPMVDRGVSVLVNYVLVPIILVYALILHAYAVKIAVTMNLPKGQIGSLVTIFALGGTATYLIAHPWRDTGTRLLRWFLGSWFWITLVPVGLLAIAVWRRVSDYGLTPDRYGLILVGIWLAAMAVYLAFRRRSADMRVIVASLGVLLLGASLGPWGAQGASIANQFGRLEAILTTTGLLSDGRIVQAAAKDELSGTDRNKIGSIVWFLLDANAGDRLRPWFAGSGNDPWATSDTHLVRERIGKALGVEVAPNIEQMQYVYFNADKPLARPLSPAGVLVGPVRVPPQDSKPAAAEAASPARAVNRGDRIEFISGSRSWTVKAADLLARLGNAVPQAPNREPIVIEVIGETGQLIVIIDHLQGQDDGAVGKITSGAVWLILPQ